MKGQKLFVRPIEPADAESIRDFCAVHGGAPDTRAGLIGKLVGDLAAVLTMELEADAVRIVDLVVAEPLRRKRVGRVMLDELASMAAKLDRSWLVAGCVQTDFLRRVGFEEHGGVMRRRV
jgi:N-acetylglutamate synthase-like GNAT family acetyltransferase